MANITFTVPTNKVSDFQKTVQEIIPVPVDKNDVPLFTDAQWAKEGIIRYIKMRDRMRRENEARQIPTPIVEDDALIT